MEEDRREQRSIAQQEANVWVSPTTFAVIVAVGVGFLNYRKLNLDLFDKRYKSYREMFTQIEAYEKARFDRRVAGAGFDSISDAKAKFEDACREMSFLFGPDVADVVARLEQAYTDEDNLDTSAGVGEYDYGRSMQEFHAGREVRGRIPFLKWTLKQACGRYLQFWGIWEKSTYFVHTLPTRMRTSRWWAEGKVRSLRTDVPDWGRRWWKMLRKEQQPPEE